MFLFIESMRPDTGKCGVSTAGVNAETGKTRGGHQEALGASADSVLDLRH